MREMTKNNVLREICFSHEETHAARTQSTLNSWNQNSKKKKKEKKKERKKERKMKKRKSAGCVRLFPRDALHIQSRAVT